MRYAIISDIHGHADVLRRALAFLQEDAIDRIVTLGDIGSDDCFDLLRASGATGVFGNWEVSGYARLSPRNRVFVLEQRPVLAEDDFLAAHAMPSYPAGLFNVADFADHMHRTETGWRSLFRYPDEGGDHLWTIFAELETRAKSVFFHGHTHRQVAWRIAPYDRPREVRGPIVVGGACGPLHRRGRQPRAGPTMGRLHVMSCTIRPATR